MYFMFPCYHIIIPTNEATSEFGISSQFNPSKLIIDVLAAVGLVWGRKRGTAACDMGMARRDRDREAGVPLSKPAPRPWKLNAVVKQD
jgi:stearoyl-CoA desaturase (delta-9 desaturase)